MVQSLQLSSPQRHIKRVNRLPLLVAGTMALIVLAAIVVGLSSRGLGTRSDTGPEASSDGSASTFAENLKRGIVDGIIAEPVDATVSANPSTRPLADGPAPEMKTTSNAAAPEPEPATADRRNLENDDDWLGQLARERKEQLLRERHRQDMARLQARDAALDSPLTVEIAGVRDKNAGSDISNPEIPMSQQRGSDLYAKAMAEGFGANPNGQASKQAFFNADIKELGYLPNGVLPAQSPFELKRGSVIPATLISGINSDLPGRISAQVSRPIFDSATGRHLLIPQGAKLFGRYDSEVSFGQSRVLAIWTDLIFPNGATLQLGGMAGTDATGYGGFKDKVDRHILRTFGSAALVALIGAGIDMSLPSDGPQRDRDTASDAARRSFAETFGRVAERTIGKNLDVQPTLRIRPGYMFNVLVDQDIIFPGTYR